MSIIGFLPTIVALARDHKDVDRISIYNSGVVILLVVMFLQAMYILPETNPWTAICFWAVWLVCFLWAFTGALPEVKES